REWKMWRESSRLRRRRSFEMRAGKQSVPRHHVYRSDVVSLSEPETNVYRSQTRANEEHATIFSQPIERVVGPRVQDIDIAGSRQRIDRGTISEGQDEYVRAKASALLH